MLRLFTSQPKQPVNVDDDTSESTTSTMDEAEAKHTTVKPQIRDGKTKGVSKAPRRNGETTIVTGAGSIITGQLISNDDKAKIGNEIPFDYNTIKDDNTGDEYNVYRGRKALLKMTITNQEQPFGDPETEKGAQCKFRNIEFTENGKFDLYDKDGETNQYKYKFLEQFDKNAIPEDMKFWVETTQEDYNAHHEEKPDDYKMIHNGNAVLFLVSMESADRSIVEFRDGATLRNSRLDDIKGNDVHVVCKGSFIDGAHDPLNENRRANQTVELNEDIDKSGLSYVPSLKTDDYYYQGKVLNDTTEAKIREDFGNGAKYANLSMYTQEEYTQYIVEMRAKYNYFDIKYKDGDKEYDLLDYMKNHYVPGTTLNTENIIITLDRSTEYPEWSPIIENNTIQDEIIERVHHINDGRENKLTLKEALLHVFPETTLQIDTITIKTAQDAEEVTLEPCEFLNDETYDSLEPSTLTSVKLYELPRNGRSENVLEAIQDVEKYIRANYDSGKWTFPYGRQDTFFRARFYQELLLNGTPLYITDMAQDITNSVMTEDAETKKWSSGPFTAPNGIEREMYLDVEQYEDDGTTPKHFFKDAFQYSELITKVIPNEGEPEYTDLNTNGIKHLMKYKWNTDLESEESRIWGIVMPFITDDVEIKDGELIEKINVDKLFGRYFKGDYVMAENAVLTITPHVYGNLEIVQATKNGEPRYDGEVPVYDAPFLNGHYTQSALQSALIDAMVSFDGNGSVIQNIYYTKKNSTEEVIVSLVDFLNNGIPEGSTILYVTFDQVGPELPNHPLTKPDEIRDAINKVAECTSYDQAKKYLEDLGDYFDQNGFLICPHFVIIDDENKKIISTPLAMYYWDFILETQNYFNTVYGSASFPLIDTEKSTEEQTVYVKVVDKVKEIKVNIDGNIDEQITELTCTKPYYDTPNDFEGYMVLLGNYEYTQLISELYQSCMKPGQEGKITLYCLVPGNMGFTKEYECTMPFTTFKDLATEKKTLVDVINTSIEDENDKLAMVEGFPYSFPCIITHIGSELTGNLTTIEHNNLDAYENVDEMLEDANRVTEDGFEHDIMKWLEEVEMKGALTGLTLLITIVKGVEGINEWYGYAPLKDYTREDIETAVQNGTLGFSYKTISEFREFIEQENHTTSVNKNRKILPRALYTAWIHYTPYLAREFLDHIRARETVYEPVYTFKIQTSEGTTTPTYVEPYFSAMILRTRLQDNYEISRTEGEGEDASQVTFMLRNSIVSCELLLINPIVTFTNVKSIMRYQRGYYVWTDDDMRNIESYEDALLYRYNFYVDNRGIVFTDDYYSADILYSVYATMCGMSGFGVVWYNSEGYIVNDEVSVKDGDKPFTLGYLPYLYLVLEDENGKMTADSIKAAVQSVFDYPTIKMTGLPTPAWTEAYPVNYINYWIAKQLVGNSISWYPDLDGVKLSWTIEYDLDDMSQFGCRKATKHFTMPIEEFLTLVMYYTPYTTYTINYTESPVVPPQPSVSFFGSWKDAEDALIEYLNADSHAWPGMREFLQTWQYRCAKLNTDDNDTTWGKGWTFKLVEEHPEEGKEPREFYLDDLLQGPVDLPECKVVKIDYKIERTKGDDDDDSSEEEGDDVTIVDGAEFFSNCSIVMYEDKEMKVYSPNYGDDIQNVINAYNAIDGNTWSQTKTVIDGTIEDGKSVFEQLEEDRELYAIVDGENDDSEPSKVYTMLLFLQSQYGTIIQEVLPNYDIEEGDQLCAFMVQTLGSSNVIVNFNNVINNEDLKFTTIIPEGEDGKKTVLREYVSTSLYNMVMMHNQNEGGYTEEMNICLANPYLQHLTAEMIPGRELMYGYVVIERENKDM